MRRRSLIRLGILVVFFRVIFILTGIVRAAERKEVTIGHSISLMETFSLRVMMFSGVIKYGRIRLERKEVYW